MGKLKMNDFIVDSKGLCFFCLGQVKTEANRSESPTISSLLYLSRYLKLDIRQVLHENVLTTSPNLLDKVEKSQLKAELCDNCIYLNAQLAGLCHQVEKVEMEISTHLRALHSKLEIVGRDSSSGCVADMEKLFDKRKYEIMEVLRKETKFKCSNKLDHILPRIRLQNLNAKEVHQKVFKIQRQRRQRTLSTTTTPSVATREVEPTTYDRIDTSHIKLESLPHNSSLEAEESCDDDDSVGVPHSPSPDVEHKFVTDGDPQDSYHQNAHIRAVHTKANSNKRVKIKEEDSITSEINGFQIITLPEKIPTRAKFGEGSVSDNCVVNSDTGRHTCKKCFKECSGYQGFYQHYRSQHLNIKYSCSACGTLFTTASHLNRHQRRLHKLVKFQCQGCNQLFPLESTLSTHDCSLHKLATTNLTDGETKYRCGKCNQVFSWRSSYTKHRRLKACREKGKPRTPGKHECQVCGKVYQSIRSLENHMSEEHKPRDHKCDICSKRFRSVSTLIRHRDRVHKGIK